MIGKTIGPYEVVAKLGEGGMGEVYRARDTRLDRSVAIKVLSPRITTAPEFLERFHREARAISQLNHPHICTLHDIGEQDGTPYLVLEYVEGETLAARLARGPLPVEQALTIGIQISDALDKAHRQGIMHRDLKPGNVMLVGKSAAPHAKLLDFGLAKAAGSGLTASGALGEALTAISPLTAQGTLLGTLQYMAPEQIEGRDADWRSDIFALGAVLHEMVSGQRAFTGTSSASVIAAILERTPPPLSTLQPVTPPTLDHVVARCLAKDPDDRWQNAGDIMHELKWVAGTPAIPTSAPGSRSRRREYLWLGVALALAVALGAKILMPPTQSSEAAGPVELPLLLPAEVSPGGLSHFSISPNGRHLVFVEQRGLVQRLWIKSLDGPDARPLEGTERAANPFWSHDSQRIGFFVPGQLKHVGVEGGPVQLVCALVPRTVPRPAPGEGAGGTWNRNNVILFADVDNGLFTVPAAGGKPAQRMKRDRGAIVFPIFLPDGDHFLYVDRRPPDRQGEGMQLYAASLGAPLGQPVTRVGSGNVAFDPSGYLLYLGGGPERQLMAQPFDPERLQPRGDPQQLASHIHFIPYLSRGAFSVSATGVLLYQTDPARDSELVLVNREGKEPRKLGPPGRYTYPAFSPKGDRVAYALTDTPTAAQDIYLVDIARRGSSKFTSGPQRNSAPVWSPDGTRIAFHSSGQTAPGPGMYVKAVDAARKEDRISGPLRPTDWSTNGFIIGEQRTRSAGIFTVPSSGDSTVTDFLDTEFQEVSPSFSLDGRWVAYQSNETGRAEVYVWRFDRSGRPEPISGSAGGHFPRWSPNGKELFYLTDDGNWMMAVDIRADETLEVGTPHPLFPVNLVVDGADRPFDVGLNGQIVMFVMVVPLGDPPPPTVLLNWTARLKR